MRVSSIKFVVHLDWSRDRIYNKFKLSTENNKENNSLPDHSFFSIDYETTKQHTGIRTLFLVIKNNLSISCCRSLNSQSNDVVLEKTRAKLILHVHDIIKTTNHTSFYWLLNEKHSWSRYMQLTSYRVAKALIILSTFCWCIAFTNNRNAKPVFEISPYLRP